ncbi:hypothetical protein GCM10009557_63260 [Virgisporangium ochraceum]
MTLDEVAAELYALPPEEFTAARGEAVAAARKAGDRELASQIGGLRRPTVGAWLVNLLAHQRPDLIGELLSLGAAMRAAQRNLRGDELRELSTQRRAMVSSLARESRALAVAAGRGVRAVLPLGEVENTVTAALADPDIADEVRLGGLRKPVEYAGFGEQPRPQLRLVQGGAQGGSQGGSAMRGPDAPPSEPAARKGATVSTIAGRKAKRGVTEEEELERRIAEDEEFERQAAAEHEAAKRRLAEQEAARKAAAEQRRRQQAAHRELLAARTALAEAEAKRTEVEKAVRDAKRRVEQAMAAVQAATPG